MQSLPDVLIVVVVAVVVIDVVVVVVVVVVTWRFGCQSSERFVVGSATIPAGRRKELNPKL